MFSFTVYRLPECAISIKKASSTIVLFVSFVLLFLAFPLRTPQGGIEKNLCAFAVRKIRG